MRTGLIAKKLGMSRVFTAEGVSVPVTLLHTSDCQVVATKQTSKDGYSAVQVGAFNKKVKNVSKALRGHFAKNKVEPKQKMVEFRVSEEGMLQTGDQLCVSHFVPGQAVDVKGLSQGKGFQGGMKRHNFGGLEATHGVSISHRSHGSTGQCQEPGRVFKGKKMAGQMGHTQVTKQNLEVVVVDTKEGIIAVKGSVPGGKNTFVTISDASKKTRPESAPFPGALIKAEAKEEVAQAAEAEAEQKVEADASSATDTQETKDDA